MADIIIKILTPATSFAILTLDEVKTMLGIGASDTTQDVRLQQMIDWYSAYVSQIANRVFAKEKLSETWRDLQDRRIFTSHWPVKESDIVSVEAPRGSLIAGTDYELEEGSGKLSLFGSRTEPLVVTYTGGFNLPDEAPDDLKDATFILVRKAYYEGLRGSTAGIRSISHKDQRVMFFDPASQGGSIGSTEAIKAVHALLYHYARLEV
jgi:hypothetical protein